MLKEKPDGKVFPPGKKSDRASQMNVISLVSSQVHCLEHALGRASVEPWSVLRLVSCMLL